MKWSHHLPKFRVLCEIDSSHSWKFLTENGINILSSAANAATTLCKDLVCEPLRCVLPEGYESVTGDLKRAYVVVVERQKKSRDTSKRWFRVHSVDSFYVGEPSGHSSSKTSYVVEVGQVEYLPEFNTPSELPSTSTGMSGEVKARHQLNL